MNELEQLLVRGDAIQDQEIAKGRDWMLCMEPEVVRRFFDEINDASGPELRQLDDKRLAILRALALIGFHEIAKAATRA